MGILSVKNTSFHILFRFCMTDATRNFETVKIYGEFNMDIEQIGILYHTIK